MRRIIMLLLALGSVQVLKSQSIQGTVIDATTNQPVGFASVGVFKESDPVTPVQGTTSDDKGSFIISGLELGTYIVKVQFVGYAPKQLANVTLTPTNQTASLGTIGLASQGQLEAVEVQTQRSVQDAEIGKRTYNVTSDLVNRGGTAIDVLQNIPSVQVDENNNLSLRGNSNVTVFINGKQSGLTGLSRQAILDRIPASSIERIEVITNPSSKYDAEGGGGIINIILKQNREDGLNGTVGFNLGNSNRHNGNFELNYKKGKLNLTTGLSANSDTRQGEITFKRTNAFPFNNSLGFDQFRDSERDRLSLTGNIALDYSLTKKDNITLEFVTGGNWSTNDQLFLNNNFGLQREVDNYFLRNTNEENQGQNFNYTLGYTHRFAKPQQELKISGTYTTDEGSAEEAFKQGDFLADGTSLRPIDSLQRTSTEDNNSQAIAQIDYTHPFNKDWKLETGAKGIVREIKTDYLLEDFDPTFGVYQTNTNLSNNFSYDEQVYAGYVQFSGKINKIGLQAGLRSEQTYALSKLLNTGEEFRNDYLSFFPTVAVSYVLAKEQKIQATYSRRINRPSFRELNPSIDASNPLVLRSGNPFLRPEFTDAYELEYLKEWQQGSLTSAVFYRRTTDVVQRIISTIEFQGQTTNLFSPRNVTSSENYGLEVIGSYKISRAVSLNGNISAFRLVVNAQNLDGTAPNDVYTWNARLMGNFTLTKTWRAQAMVFYRGPSATAQGTRKDFFMNSIGISKQFLKNKATATLRVTDIAQTMRFGGTVNTPEFFQDFTFRGNTRTIQVGLTYRFGSLQQRQQQRRNRNNNGNDQENGGGFDGGDF